MPISADDRLSILDVIARANWAADAKDVEGTVRLYAAEGRITGAFQAEPGPEFRAALARIFEGEGTRKRHALVNPVLEERGDSVIVTWMMPVYEAEEAPALVATCRITDEFRRADGGWLITHHHVEVDPSMRADVGQRR